MTVWTAFFSLPFQAPLIEQVHFYFNPSSYWAGLSLFPSCLCMQVIEKGLKFTVCPALLSIGFVWNDVEKKGSDSTNKMRADCWPTLNSVSVCILCKHYIQYVYMCTVWYPLWHRISNRTSYTEWFGTNSYILAVHHLAVAFSWMYVSRLSQAILVILASCSVAVVGMINGIRAGWSFHDTDRVQHY